MAECNNNNSVYTPSVTLDRCGSYRNGDSELMYIIYRQDKTGKDNYRYCVQVYMAKQTLLQFILALHTHSGFCTILATTVT